MTGVHSAQERSVPGGDAESERAVPWRCFHCDFITSDHDEAAQHFGRFDDCVPACGVGIERFRAMEKELHEYRTESDAASKTFYSLGADHRSALIAEEQRGYDRGLADGMALPRRWRWRWP